MLPFRLLCLGAPQLMGPDGDPIRFRTRKHLALLVFLAVEPSVPHRRDRLAALLWPGVDLEEARHSLATALSVLRGRFGAAAFEATRDTIRLLPGRVVTDVALLLGGDPIEADTLVAGAFLEEFEIPRAGAFELWLDGQRARLLPALHDHLARRIDQCRRQGDTRRMERAADQMLRLDPLSESGVRALVEARAMAGDRIGALRVFDRWRSRVAEELGAGPGRELERMTDRLRRRGLDRPSTAQLAPVPTEQWQDRTFVGRSAEHAACYQAWERVRAGRASHLLVRGESGIGKTTLASRFATALALEGASIARVQCYELERELPFGMIGALVNAMLDLPGAAATAPAQLAELARLVARVRQHFPSLPAASGSSGEGARIQFTEAVLAMLAAIVGEQPLVVVIDDVHLADVTSLAVLHHLLRRVEHEPVLVLLTAADGDGVDPATTRFVEQAERLAIGVVPLGRLPEGHAAELLDVLLAGCGEPGPTVRRALLAGARGNPMLLELLVGDWRRRGDGSLALAVSAMTAQAARPGDAAFRRVVEGMLEALDTDARAVADLAAILGQRLNDLGMYTLVDLPVTRTMRAMTTLTAQRVLRDAGSHLEFANEVVRGHCYLSMAQPLRRMLHSLVADRLLAALTGNAPIPGLEVAWHLVRADRLGEAVPYLLAGGREAIRGGAPHEADLALSTGLPALRGAPRRTALLLLAEALQELGRWDESLRVLEAPGEAFDEAEESWREVLRVVGRRWLGVLTGTQLQASTANLISIAEMSMDIEVRVKALSTSVRLLTVTRDSASECRLAEVLTSLQRETLDGYQALHLSLAAAWLQCSQGDPASAESLLATAASEAHARGYRSSLAVRLLIGLGNTRSLLGQYKEAVEPLELAAALSASLDNLALSAESLAQLSLAHGRLGNRRQQLDAARQAMRLYGPNECSAGVVACAFELGTGLALESRTCEARAVAEGVLNRLRPDSPEWLMQAALLCAADIERLAGYPKRGMQLARRALEQSNGRLLDRGHAGQFARWIAFVATEDGELLSARQRLARLIPANQCLHRKDACEVLIAEALLSEEEHSDGPPAWDKAHHALSQLPRGVHSVLVGLGCLPHYRPGWGVR